MLDVLARTLASLLVATALAAVATAVAVAQQRGVLQRALAVPGSVTAGQARGPVERGAAASRVLSAGLLVCLALFSIWLHRCVLVARRLTGHRRWASWTAYLALVPLAALVVVPVHARDAWRAARRGTGAALPVWLWWGAVVVLLGGVALSGLQVSDADAFDPARRALGDDAGLALADGLVAAALLLTAGFVVLLSQRLRSALQPSRRSGLRPAR